MSSPYSVASDVSLDEEDEELIGRVFYGDAADVSDDNISELLESDLQLVAQVDPELVRKYRHLKTKSVLTEEERRRLVMSSFSSDQMDRFEAYRRTTINKPGVKKVCNGVLGHSIPQNIAVVLAGISKLFVSEIITKAFEVQEKEFKADLWLQIDQKKRHKREILKNLDKGEDVEINEFKLHYRGELQEPLRPEHIREAVRLYKKESSGGMRAEWRGQGEGDGRMFR